MFGNRSAGLDHDFVTDFLGIAWVVDLVALSKGNELLVLLILHVSLHDNNNRIFHLVRYDDSREGLSFRSDILLCFGFFHIILLRL